MINFDLPRVGEDEFAIVVIGGPSQGESVLVHYGDGKWIVIDSCTYGGVNLPLLVLEKLHADNASVTRVICTHWHDDHVAGMSDILNECPNSYFLVPSVTNAIILPQYFVYKSEKAVKENEKEAWQMFQKCLDVLLKRNDVQDPELKEKQFVKIGESILDYDTHHTHIDIKALSPSQQMCSKFGQMLAAGDADSCEFDDSGIEPNMCSISLGIKFGRNHRSLFLGADLECNRPKDAAYNSCVGECNQRHDIGMCNLKESRHVEPFGHFSYTKINHHSSKTGYCCHYWNSLVDGDSIGVSTVFTSKNLPRREIASLYYENNSSFYITSQKPMKKLKKEEFAKVLGDKQYVTSLKQIDTTPGIVITKYDIETGDYKGTETYLNAVCMDKISLKFFPV